MAKITRRFKLISAAFTSLTLASAAWAQEPMQAPNWDRSLAALTASQADTGERLRSLFDSARRGDSESTLRSLREAGRDPALPSPALEGLLFRFATGLGDLPPGSVNRQVLDHLLDYQPRTLVPHDDRGDVGVPLFNIRAAASGVVNIWERQRAADRARRMLDDEPEQWVQAYLRADDRQRGGFADALELAGDDQLRVLKPRVLALLASRKDLTEVAGLVALYSDDPQALEIVLAHGHGPALAPLLAASAQAFTAAESAGMLAAAIRSAPAENAALAIAQLAPVLADHPDSRALLLESLADPELGSAAALALAHNPTPESTAALADLAARRDGIAARRAALALRMSAASETREGRQ